MYHFAKLLSHKMLYVTWYNLYILKNVKSNHEGVLLLVKLYALTCNFNKSDSPPWMLLTFFKWYKIVHHI